jgi:hypothetical protein
MVRASASAWWTSPGLVESGCYCCRRCCAQPEVVHRFVAPAPARAPRRARPSGSPAACRLRTRPGAHPQRAVKPGRVVEALDELEDRRAQLGAGCPSSLRGAVQQALLGERREERLGDGVVKTGPDRAHQGRVGLSQVPTELTSTAIGTRTPVSRSCPFRWLGRFQSAMVRRYAAPAYSASALGRRNPEGQVRTGQARASRGIEDLLEDLAGEDRDEPGRKD